MRQNRSGKRISGSESAHVVKRRGEGPGEVARGGCGRGGGDLQGNFGERDQRIDLGENRGEWIREGEEMR